MGFDFSGWATRANIKCSDGRTIMKDAFKHMDGAVVPLVWNHQHNDPNEILGKALLEHRDEGVYAYCTFNETESGRTAKLLVQHGDINQLSIFANKLKQQMSNVLHGDIREVSLVLAGANPGAYIESIIKHGEECDEEAIIYTGMDIALCHSDGDKEEKKEEKSEKGEETVAAQNNEEVKEVKTDAGEETVADVFNTLSEKQKTVVYALIGQALEGDASDDEADKEVKHAATAEDGEETVADVFNTLDEKQKTVVYALIGQALEDAGDEDDAEDVKHSDEYDDEEYDEDDYEDYDEDSEGGDEIMKHNLFDQEPGQDMEVLSHSEMADIVSGITRYGSLKESFLQHGIENIGEFFPEVKTVGDVPALVKRNDSWVNEVLNGVHRTPFSRIKTMYADITAAEARAKGYVKGDLKVEEVIKAFKRTTTPATVYKKQKLDRDDVLDITDFDVIAFLRAEMRMMLEEEIARAILIGDGREPDAQDHIDEECIRPIWTDSDVYTVKTKVEVAASATAEEKAKAFIKACVKSRKNYKGSGSPVMYMSEDILTDCLLIEDTNGRRIYETIDKLASALTVKKIVPVTVMDNVTRKVGEATHTLAGLYVNLADYNVGADKGGAINMFDDFDIDYNQQKYLIETRCSGALIKPAAAVAIEFVDASAQG